MDAPVMVVMTRSYLATVLRRSVERAAVRAASAVSAGALTRVRPDTVVNPETPSLEEVDPEVPPVEPVVMTNVEYGLQPDDVCSETISNQITFLEEVRPVTQSGVECNVVLISSAEPRLQPERLQPDAISSLEMRSGVEPCLQPADIQPDAVACVQEVVAETQSAVELEVA